MTRRIKTTAVLTLAALVINSATFFAKGNSQIAKETNQEVLVPEKGVKNLEVGISSDNEGLRKSSIYMAGAYQVKELVSPLVKQLSRENDENIKVLISLALYMIGSDDAVAAVNNSK